jgi:hypothetical protein
MLMKRLLCFSYRCHHSTLLLMMLIATAFRATTVTMAF